MTVEDEQGTLLVPTIREMEDGTVRAVDPEEAISIAQRLGDGIRFPSREAGDQFSRRFSDALGGARPSRAAQIAQEVSGIRPGEFANLNEQQLRDVVARSARTDPDRFARVLEVSNQLQVPILHVEQNLDRYEKSMAAAGELQEQPLEVRPVLRAWLSESETARRLAHDDIRALSGIEWAWNAIKASYVDGQGLLELAEFGNRRLRGERLTVQESLEEFELARQLQENYGAEGFFERGIAGASQMTPLLVAAAVGGLERGPQFALTGAAAGAVGGPAFAATGLLAGISVGVPFGAFETIKDLERGLAFNQYLGIEGVNRDHAAAAAEVAGNINGLIELASLGLAGRAALTLGGSAWRAITGRSLTTHGLRTGVGALLEASPKFVERAVRTGSAIAAAQAGEVGEEFLQAVVTETGGQLLEGRLAPGESITAGIEEAIAVAPAVMVLGGLGVGLQGTVELAAHGARAARARTQGARLERTVRKAVEAKLRERSRETFEEFVERVQGTERTELSIPAERLVEYFQKADETMEEALEDLPGVAEQLPLALESGADVVIPLAGYLSVLGPDHHKGLAQDLRVDTGDMTLREAKQFVSNADALVEDVEVGEQEDQQQAAGAQEVHDRVLALAADAGHTGRGGQAIASLWAARYAERGRRQGVDPLELFERENPQVVTAEVAPERVLSEEGVDFAVTETHLQEGEDVLPGTGIGVFVREEGEPAVGPTEQLELVPAPARPRRPRAKAVRGEGPRVEVVQTGTFRAGITQVAGPEDVAHIVAPLRREAQESFLAVVTDAQGEVLRILRSTVGGTGEVLALPDLILGSAFDTPGAAEVWTVHNHPAGIPSQSREDVQVLRRFHENTRGTGLNYRGSIVVAPGGKATFRRPTQVGQHDEAAFTIPARARDREIGIFQRRFRKAPRAAEQGPSITNAAQLHEQMVKFGGRNTGVLFLSNRNQPIGFLPMTMDEMRRLRTEDPQTGVGAILRTVSQRNAQGIALRVGVGQREAQSTLNMTTFATAAGLGILDVIDTQGESTRAMGQQIPTRAEMRFFQRDLSPFEPQKTKAGKFKGVPEWVTGKRQLTALRKLIRASVLEGQTGRFWYEDSARAVMAAVRGDVVEAEKFIQLLAIYSARVSVPSNTTFAVRAYTQWKAGVPRDQFKVTTQDRDFAATELLYGDTPWEGRKTHSFYLNLMHGVLETATNEQIASLDLDMTLMGRITAPVTADVWVFRGFGYRTDAAAGDLGSGRYSFAENELNRMAAELGGDWLPHQVQAAFWTAMKARFEIPEVRKATIAESVRKGLSTYDGGKWLPPVEPEARAEHLAIWRKHAMKAPAELVVPAMERARASFADTMQRMTNNVTWEAIPSTSLAHPINRASPAVKRQFTDESVALMVDEDGTDRVAAELGVHLVWTDPGSGGYAGEITPNVVTRILPNKPAGNFSKAEARAYALALQFIYKQDAVPWFRPDSAAKFDKDFAVRRGDTTLRRFPTLRQAQAFAEGKEGVTIQGGPMSRGMALRFREPLTRETEEAVFKLLREALGEDVGYTKTAQNELSIINFRGDDGLPFLLDDEEFVAKLEGLVGKHGEAQGIEDLVRFGAESEYGYEHDWKADPAGEAILQQGGLAGRPDLHAWLRSRRALTLEQRAPPEEGAGKPPTAGASLFGRDLDFTSDAVKKRLAEEGKTEADFLREGAQAIKGDRANLGMFSLDVLAGPHQGQFLNLTEIERRAQARAILRAMDASPPSSVPLFRGAGGDVPAVGDTVDLGPIAGFTPSQQRARKFGAPRGRKILYRVMPGARAFDLTTVTSAFLEEAEQLAAGPFRVVSVEQKAQHSLVTIEQVAGPQRELFQGPNRGSITFGPDLTNVTIRMFEAADLSTFLHESGHLFFEQLRQDALANRSPEDVRDWDSVHAELIRLGLASPDANAPLSSEAHDQLARWMEAYLKQGNAPTSELRDAFARFAAWLVHVYKQLIPGGVELTEPVRQVMDRMLASEEAIEQSRQTGERVQLIQQPGDLMTPEEFDAYERASGRQRAAAVNEFMQKTMRELRQVQSEERRQARAEISAEVEADVRRRPAFLVRHWLETGEFLDGREPPPGLVHQKLSRDALRDLYGRSRAKRVAPRFVQREGGLHPDELAETFGFETGDDLVDSLLDRRTMKQTIDAEVEAKMRERFPSVLEGEELAEAAVQAWENDPVANMLLTEQRVLSRRAGQPPTPAKVAREAARRIVAEEPVRNLKPHRARQAQQRASREAAQAFAARDWTEAANAKRRELIQFYVAIESQKAKDEEAVIVNRLRKFSQRKVQERIGQAGADYLEKIIDMLERFNLRPISLKRADKLSSLAQWIQAREAEGEEVIISEQLRNEAFQTHYKNLTIDQLRALDDATKHIAHLARKKVEYMLAGQQRSLLAMGSEMAAEADENIQRKVADRRTNTPVPEGTDVLMNLGLKLDASMSKAEFVADALAGAASGQRGGDPMSLWHRAVIQPLLAAMALYQQYTTENVLKVDELVLALRSQPQGRLNAKRTYAELTDEKGQPFVLDRWGLIALALNLGNQSNRKKLLGGYGWEFDQVMGVLNAELTAQDWAFVQGCWDAVESWGPLAFELERRISGVAPPKIEAEELETASGTLKGGYWPVVYDPRRSKTGALALAKSVFAKQHQGFTRATTGHGHLTERTDVEKPILLDVSVLTSHLDQVALDLAFREPLMEVGKLLSRQEVDAALIRNLGNEFSYQKFWLPWLQAIAGDVRDTSAMAFWAKGFRSLRKNATIFTLGLSHTTLIVQPFGHFNALKELRQALPRNVLKHYLWGFRSAIQGMSFTKMKQQWDRVHELSVFMRNRANAMTRDQRDIIRDASATALKSWPRQQGQKLQAFAMELIGRWQKVSVDYPVWLAAFRGAIEEMGLDEADAVQFADRMVRQSQGGGTVIEQAAVERGFGGNEFFKAATLFYSYNNTVYQQLRSSGRGVTVRDMPSFLANYMLVVSLPGLFSYAMYAFLYDRFPDPEDEDFEERLLKQLGEAVIAEGAATVPVVRDYYPLLIGERPRKSGALEIFGREIQDLVNYKDGTDLMFDVMRSGALIGGIPASKPLRLAESLIAPDEE
jgi:hypothetical protein